MRPTYLKFDKIHIPQAMRDILFQNGCFKRVNWCLDISHLEFHISYGISCFIFNTQRGIGIFYLSEAQRRGNTGIFTVKSFLFQCK